ncbi:hypothetical protein PAPYR_4048 [Paratrimastix pyriformis]|uniref:PH domain-containing protein n=1 Tax=Paratrimastix pyriformis TaxID=342808 RepID=A0ABQ8UL94_9EUKA|nr:hypothetical protein PAPYR_4048 [Paratrimastix pyriformis]
MKRAGVYFQNASDRTKFTKKALILTGTSLEYPLSATEGATLLLSPFTSVVVLNGASPAGPNLVEFQVHSSDDTILSIHSTQADALDWAQQITRATQNISTILLQGHTGTRTTDHDSLVGKVLLPMEPHPSSTTVAKIAHAALRHDGLILRSTSNTQMIPLVPPLRLVPLHYWRHGQPAEGDPLGEVLQGALAYCVVSGAASSPTCHVRLAFGSPADLQAWREALLRAPERAQGSVGSHKSRHERKPTATLNPRPSAVSSSPVPIPSPPPPSTPPPPPTAGSPTSSPPAPAATPTSPTSTALSGTTPTSTCTSNVLPPPPRNSPTGAGSPPAGPSGSIRIGGTVRALDGVVGLAAGASGGGGGGGAGEEEGDDDDDAPVKIVLVTPQPSPRPPRQNFLYFARQLFEELTLSKLKVAASHRCQVDPVRMRLYVAPPGLTKPSEVAARPLAGSPAASATGAAECRNGWLSDGVFAGRLVMQKWLAVGWCVRWALPDLGLLDCLICRYADNLSDNLSGMLMDGVFAGTACSADLQICETI